jgi:hypothetical protein
MVVQLLMVLLLSCGSEERFVAPEFKSPKIKGVSLNIIAQFDAIQVSNMDDFRDDFKSDKSFDTLTYLLHDKLPMTISKLTYFSDVRFAAYKQDSIKLEMSTRPRRRESHQHNGPITEKKTLRISPTDSITMMLPTNLSMNDLVTLPSDFTLILDDFYIFTDHVSSGQGTHKALFYRVKYCLIENKNAKIISFGRAKAVEVPFFPVFTRDTWINNIGNIPSVIFAGTAFGRY